MHPGRRLPGEALDDRAVLWETAPELISVRHLEVLELESRSDRAPDTRIAAGLDDRPDPARAARHSEQGSPSPFGWVLSPGRGGGRIAIRAALVCLPT